MASFYTTERSPFYQLRLKRADGSWGKKSSGIRVDAPNGLKRVRALIQKHREREHLMREEGGDGVFRNWVEGWFNHRYENQKTITRYMNGWNAISAFLASKRIVHPGEVTYQLAEEWMVWRTNPPKGSGVRKATWNTALTDLSILSAIMQESVRRGLILANPLVKTGLKRRNTKEKPIITEKEEVKIRQRLKGEAKWMADAFEVAMAHGCRLSEVEIPASRINMQLKTMTLQGKGDRVFIVPIHPRILPLAKDAVERGGLLVELGKSPSKEFHNFFKKIEMPHLSFHCTRVTVATRMRDAGVTREDAMEYLNHASEVIHKIYLRSNPERLRGIHDAL